MNSFHIDVHNSFTTFIYCCTIAQHKCNVNKLSLLFNSRLESTRFNGSMSINQFILIQNRSFNLLSCSRRFWQKNPKTGRKFGICTCLLNNLRDISVPDTVLRLTATLHCVSKNCTVFLFTRATLC